MNIAMWSGPRNLSTAMMYSFAARGDCDVWDEPFYGAYLAATDIDHPMRAEILASGETDPQIVRDRCQGDGPKGKPHFYQKHMTQHMISGFPLDWMSDCVNVFLIRHPARVIASYAVKRDHPTQEDLGFQRQWELFETASILSGVTPTILDSADLRDDPADMLDQLCQAIGLPYSDAMLRWPAGGNPDDGAWAPHWYGSVHKSTGFAGPENALPELEDHYNGLLEEALPIYERLRDAALKPKK